MRIEHLQTFADLVETGSFTRSAVKNGVSQSAVSQQLRVLEKHFGISIIDPTQKHVRLTSGGQAIYRTAKEILQSYGRLRFSLSYRSPFKTRAAA